MLAIHSNEFGKTINEGGKLLILVAQECMEAYEVGAYNFPMSHAYLVLQDDQRCQDSIHFPWTQNPTYAKMDPPIASNIQWRGRRYESMLEGTEINVAQEIWRKGEEEAWNTVYRYAEISPPIFKDLEEASVRANQDMVKGGQPSSKDLVCLHEVLKDWGRIVMDFDLEGEMLTKLYFLFPKRVGNSYIPEGFTKGVERLIGKVMEGIDPSKASILKMPKIAWDAYGMAPEARPFCWTHACRSGKVSMHLTLPFFLMNLPQQMRIFYTLVNEEAKNDPDFAWLSGEPLMDMNLCSHHHQLRLPWQAKRRHGNDMKHIHRFMERHEWLHCVSGIVPVMVPDEYKLDLGWTHIHPYLECMDGRQMIGYSAQNVELDEQEVLEMIHKADIDLDSRGYDGIESCPRSHATHVGWKLKRKGCQDCICCGRNHEHTSNTPILCASESRFYLYCFQSGGSYTLAHRNGKEEKELAKQRMLEDAKRMLQDSVSSPNILNLHVMDLVDQHGIDINSRLLMIKSAMGTGKSHFTRDLIALRPDWKVLILGNRISHSEEMARDYKDLGFTYYKDGKDWKGAKRLIVELESLHHVIVPQYDLVLLDETAAIFKLFISPTMAGKELVTWNRLETYMKRSIQTICLGADLSDYVVKDLLWILRGRSHQLVINDFKPSEIQPRVVYEYNEESEFFGKILGEKRNLFLVTTRASCAINLAKRFLGKGIKPLLQIGKDKMQKAIVKHGLPEEIVQSPDARLWNQYRIVIITPAVMNGISFVEKHFQALYIYASKDGCDVDDVVQMTHRCRIFLDPDVHLYVNNSYPICGYGPIYPSEVNAYMDYGTKQWMKTKNRDRVLSVAAAWNMASMNLKYVMMMSEARRNASRRFMGDLLRERMIINLGWSIVQARYDGPKVRSTDPMPAIEHSPMSHEMAMEIQKDMDIYATYVDKEWDGFEGIYNGLWSLGEASRRVLETTCRMVQIQIAEMELKMMSSKVEAMDSFEAAGVEDRKQLLEERVKRWSTSCPGAKPKLQCWEDIQSLGMAIVEKDLMILTFNSTMPHKEPWKTIVGRIGMLWPKGFRSLQGHKVWDTLERWMKEDLLIPKIERMMVQHKDGTRTYTYKLYMEDWIGRHVVHR